MRSRIILLVLFCARSLVPQSTATEAAGVLATFTDGKTSVRLVVPAPEFYLAPDESAHPSLARSFEAEWTGLLSIARSGEYTFDAGPAAISIDGRAISNQPVSLTAGRHAFGMRYRRVAGAAAVRLRCE